jgi:MFS family permease
MLRALSSRNFRLYFFGQGLSLIGTWTQQVAMSWLVYRLTHSALLLGVVSFAAQIPNLFLSPLAGVLADRFDRRRIIIITQILLLLQALTMAFLTLTGRIQVWHIIVLDVFFGVVNSVDIPTRQTFMSDIVGRKEDLANGIALNGIMVNVTRLLGPTIGGTLIALSSEGYCFLFNSLTFIAVIAALNLMQITQKETRNTQKVWFQLKEGIRYAFGFAPIQSVLLLVAVASFMGTPYSVLMPVFVNDIFKGGPHLLGLLMACSGVGALVGAISMTFRKSVLGLGQLMAWSVGIFGFSVMVFSQSRWMPLNILALVGAGFGVMVMMTCANTLLQTLAEDHMRGRIMSLYVVALMGMMPMGGLAAGYVAQKFGAPITVFIGGCSCILGAFLFIRRIPQLKAIVHPIYIQKGIMTSWGTSLESTPQKY